MRASKIVWGSLVATVVSGLMCGATPGSLGGMSLVGTLSLVWWGPPGLLGLGPHDDSGVGVVSRGFCVFSGGLFVTIATLAILWRHHLGKRRSKRAVGALCVLSLLVWPLAAFTDGLFGMPWVLRGLDEALLGFGAGLLSVTLRPCWGASRLARQTWIVGATLLALFSALELDVPLRIEVARWQDELRAVADGAPRDARGPGTPPAPDPVVPRDVGPFAIEQRSRAANGMVHLGLKRAGLADIGLILDVPHAPARDSGAWSELWVSDMRAQDARMQALGGCINWIDIRSLGGPWSLYSMATE